MAKTPVPSSTPKLTLDSAINVPLQGTLALHCSKCLNERPAGVAPVEWARQQVHLTRDGLQVWCTRHNVNIGLFTVNR